MAVRRRHGHAAHHLGQGIHELLTLGRAGADAAWQAGQYLESPDPEAQSYLQTVIGRLELLPSHLVHRLVPGSSFSLFLLGLLAVRHRVFDAPRRHVRLIATMMGIGACLLAGVLAAAAAHADRFLESAES